MVKIYFYRKIMFPVKENHREGLQLLYKLNHKVFSEENLEVAVMFPWWKTIAYYVQSNMGNNQQQETGSGIMPSYFVAVISVWPKAYSIKEGLLSLLV